MPSVDVAVAGSPLIGVRCEAEQRDKLDESKYRLSAASGKTEVKDRLSHKLPLQ